MIEYENKDEQPQEQDLHLARPREADIAWSRMQPLYVQATPERLKQAHQFVDIRNRSDTENSVRGFPIPMKHIVIDRHNQGHEIQPGETKRGIDMLGNDIQFFIRERKSGRVDHLGRQKPKHPIEILGFDPERMLQGDQTEPEQRTEVAEAQTRGDDDDDREERSRPRPRQRGRRE